MRGAPTPEDVQQIRDLYAQYGNVSRVSRETGWCRASVSKQIRDLPTPRVGRPIVEPTCPLPAPEAGGPKCPEPVKLEWEPYEVDAAGHVGILCDSHIPCHDMPTINAWFNECKHRNVNTILLNGDIMDCAGCSDHDRSPNDTKFEEDLIAAEQFLAWLRASFPKARIIYKEGNHENRLPRYLMKYAPDLARVKQMRLDNLLSMAKYGVEWVNRKRTIELGKLLIYHGHEFKGGTGVNAARWLWLRVFDSALCGHFHVTDQHSKQTGRRVHKSTWSCGAACFLYPEWLPNNGWNNGYSMVDVSSDGTFAVTNRTVIGGTVC